MILAEAAARAGVAVLCLALARGRPALRPHAAVAVAYACLLAARTVGARWLPPARLAVADVVLWPAPAVWLVLVTLGWTRSAATDPISSTRLGSPLVRGGSRWTSFRASLLISSTFALYALLLARCGWHLRAVWPWPLILPSVAPALAVALVGRRPRTWPEVGACVLPASCLADVVTTWAGAPDVVRQVMAAVTWATMCGILAGCRRAAG